MKAEGDFLRVVHCISLLVIFLGALYPVHARADDRQTGGAAAVLTTADCIKCHEGPVSDIAARGMAHKTRVTCVDCHVGHPPEQPNIIPECSRCHEGKAHFELDGCLSCHVNPHAPLDIKLGKDLTAPCLTCHEDKGNQLSEHPSSHSRFSCTTFCHPKRHGNVPTCFKCHRPHSDAMTRDDCRQCHQAHMPLVITYGPDVASESCGACHRDVYQLLTSTPTKHRRLRCVQCHADKHKAIPHCSDCHGKPHPAAIHERFPVCGDCHGIAHSVNPGKLKRFRQQDG